MKRHADVEIRETDGRPRLTGVIMTEGTAARGGLAEVFEPGSIAWPEEGIDILVKHYGRPEARAIPVREAGGAIRVSAPATPSMVDAVRAGKDKLSIEFHAVAEVRTAGGVRAIQRALVTGATLTNNPEYETAVEVRERRPTLWL